MEKILNFFPLIFLSKLFIYVRMQRNFFINKNNIKLLTNVVLVIDLITENLIYRNNWI